MMDNNPIDFTVTSSRLSINTHETNFQDVQVNLFSSKKCFINKKKKKKLRINLAIGNPEGKSFLKKEKKITVCFKRLS